MQTNATIQGVEYVFPERIEKVFPDTISHYLTVQLRGETKDNKLNNKGVILQYNVKEQKILWNKEIAYLNDNLQQFNDIMLLKKGNKGYRIGIDSGNERGQLSTNILFVDRTHKIGVGYPYNPLATPRLLNRLEGIDLNNGNTLWKRNLNRDYGWNDMFYYNDSTLMVVSSGIHQVNTKDGSGWSYNTLTGDDEYIDPNNKGTGLLLLMSGALGGAVGGALAGALIGYDNINNNNVYGVVSNILEQDACYYLASREQITKINNQTGEIIWKCPLPKNLTGKSSIFIDNNQVFMVNSGFAFKGANPLDYGKPFIAAFDKETGKQKFFVFFEKPSVEYNSENDRILDYKFFDDHIFLLFKDRITQYSKTGTLVSTKYIPTTFGLPKYFIDNQIFISQNNNLINLSETDSTKMFIVTHYEKVLAIDSALNITEKEISQKDVAICYLQRSDYRFIGTDRKTYVLNTEGVIIAELNAGSNAFLKNNTLYDKQNNKLITIDLSKIIK